MLDAPIDIRLEALRQYAQSTSIQHFPSNVHLKHNIFHRIFDYTYKRHLSIKMLRD